MFVLFEEAGKFLAGRVLSEAESSAQVELDSGKRVKVKSANVLLKFDKPAPAELVREAQALAPSIEWLGTMWSHAVAPSTPIPDLELHVLAWRHHFGALFGAEALARVRGFSPPEMGLPIHPDACFAFVRALRRCGYRWLMVQEHTVENPDGSLRDYYALIDGSAFFLHRSFALMSPPERRAVEAANDAACSLAGRKVLIVDDDMRNIFALATLLDQQGMAIVSAENGRDAIRLVQEDEDIDIVLMDIMMPEMDGMQTMRELRRLPRGKQLPLVAVTAKAMKGDREKCIEAGAWDYLSKPVDTNHLLVVLRGWLCS